MFANAIKRQVVYRSTCIVCWLILSAYPTFAAASSYAALDNAFGVAGVVTIPAYSPQEVAQLANGKLLVVGSTAAGPTLLRLNRDGTPDSSFGQSGVVRLRGQGFPLSVYGGPIVLPDGRFLLAATTVQPCTNQPTCGSSGVARFLADGSLDSSYGVGGFATLKLQGGTILAATPDGHILAVENYTTGGFFPTRNAYIERLTPTGVVDGGWPFPCGDQGSALIVQPDGKFVVAGILPTPPTDNQCVARFTSDGNLDPAFGTDGIRLIVVAWGAQGPRLTATAAADGTTRIVVATILGGFISGPSTVVPGSLIRLLPDGSTDPAFGTPPGSGTAPNKTMTPLSVDCAAKLVGGYDAHPTVTSNRPQPGLFVVRFNSNGVADATFTEDGSGQTFLPLGSVIEEISTGVLGVFVRDDGELIVVAGLGRSAAMTVDLVVAAYHQPDCIVPNDALSNTVFEYYNPALDHYFITTFADDIYALDSGRFSGWHRTGYTFSAARTTTDLSPVCRFYIPPTYGDSHFFSASPVECAAVSNRFPQFDLETDNAMRMGLPDPTTGACSSLASVAVYRLWDQRVDTDHRYTTDVDVRAQMIARGWVAEGYGAVGVAMCARPQ